MMLGRLKTLIEEAHGKSSFMGTIIIQIPNITHVHGCIGLVKCTKLRRRSKGYCGNKHKPKNYWSFTSYACQLFLYVISGTHFYFDKQTTDGKSYFQRGTTISGKYLVEAAVRVASSSSNRLLQSGNITPL
ncbi:hypothetical protein YC2023_088816 [Brassica napus]